MKKNRGSLFKMRRKIIGERSEGKKGEEGYCRTKTKHLFIEGRYFKVHQLIVILKELQHSFKVLSPYASGGGHLQKMCLSRELNRWIF